VVFPLFQVSFNIQVLIETIQGNFNAASDVPNGNGRRGHVSHVFGQMVVTQGGQDDWTLRPASFAIGSLEPGAVSACNWPFDCFPRQMQQVIGQPVDAIASVALSSSQSLSVSFLLSMPPIIISYARFSCLSAFEFASINLFCISDRCVTGRTALSVPICRSFTTPRPTR
jgi:hypothetical protein